MKKIVELYLYVLTLAQALALAMAVAVPLALIFGWTPAHATASAATANSVTCAAAGSSTQVLAAAAARESYLITNTSGATVRIGFVAGASAPNLTDSSSILLLAGQTLADSAPSIFIGRIVCMSIDATPDLIYVIETRKP